MSKLGSILHLKSQQEEKSGGKLKLCYLIAKRFGKPGCIAVESERGKDLAKTVISLSKLTAGKDVQILTVSSMDAYGEYRPYHVLNNQDEFTEQVLVWCK